MVDNATESDGKEFYTISTPDENVFYLVVDKQRDGNNVYFLNAVTESDLAALAQKDAAPEPVAPVEPEPTTPKEPEEPSEPEPPVTEPEQPAKKSNSTMLIVLIVHWRLAALATISRSTSRSMSWMTPRTSTILSLKGPEGTDRQRGQFGRTGSIGGTL